MPGCMESDAIARRPIRHKGIWVELERCTDCRNHTHCTMHQEEKYDMYEQKVRDCIGGRCPIEVNPGPLKVGVRFRQIKYSPNLFQAVPFASEASNSSRMAIYPRLGAFEVYVCRGSQRQEVFSKLATQRWPQDMKALLEKIKEAAEQLGEKLQEAVALERGSPIASPPSPSSASASPSRPGSRPTRVGELLNELRKTPEHRPCGEPTPTMPTHHEGGRQRPASPQGGRPRPASPANLGSRPRPGSPVIHDNPPHLLPDSSSPLVAEALPGMATVAPPLPESLDVGTTSTGVLCNNRPLHGLASDIKPAPVVNPEGHSLPSSTTASTSDLRASRPASAAHAPLPEEAEVDIAERPAHGFHRTLTSGSNAFSTFEEASAIQEVLEDTDPAQQLEQRRPGALDLPSFEDEFAHLSSRASTNDEQNDHKTLTKSGVGEMEATFSGATPSERSPSMAQEVNDTYSEFDDESLAQAPEHMVSLHLQGPGLLGLPGRPPELQESSRSDTYSNFDDSPQAHASPAMQESLQKAALQPHRQMSATAGSDTFSGFEESV